LDIEAFFGHDLRPSLDGILDMRHTLGYSSRVDERSDVPEISSSLSGYVGRHSHSFI
jgi:hypothetical protein